MAVINYEEMARDIAEKALDEYEYKGKTLRQWVDMLCNMEQESEQIKKRQEGKGERDCIIDELEDMLTRLSYDDLAFLHDLCMKQMAILASAEKYKAMDLAEDFKRAKRIAQKLGGMMLALGEQND